MTEFSTFGWAQLAGRNSHHIIEATFKAFARALRQATEHDPRRLGTVPRFDMNQFHSNSFDWIINLFLIFGESTMLLNVLFTL